MTLRMGVFQWAQIDEASGRHEVTQAFTVMGEYYSKFWNYWFAIIVPIKCGKKRKTSKNERKR